MNFLQITRTEFTVAQYIGWMRSGELELNPNFQRRSVWKPKAKSYFIDTVARGLPIPIIFLRERTDLNTLRTIREVVDGQQRLRTLLAYISPPLLPDFNQGRDEFTVTKLHNKDIGGMSFDKLSTSIRENIISYQISTHVLPSSTSDAEVLDMFRRMNASGVKLNDQELRNAEFFGDFSEVSKALARTYLEQWRNWGIFSEAEFARMREVEFVSELLMLVDHGIQEKTQSSINGYYKRYDDGYPRATEAVTLFHAAMNNIERFIGQRMRSTPFSNTGVFYCLFASLLDMQYGPASSRNVRETRPHDFPPHLDDRLREVARSLSQRKDLPTAVNDALISRSNRFSNRKAVRDFIREILTDNASN